jgi:hypothetical protein
MKTMRVMAVVSFLALTFTALCSTVAFAVAYVPRALIAMGTAGEITDIDSMDEAMKIFFTDPIVQNTVTDTELLDMFLLDNNVQYEQTTGGRYIETAQYFRLPSGVGARAHGEYIPVPSGPLIKNSRIYLKKIQAVTEMEGDVMARVRGDMGAYLNWMERALPDVVVRMKDSIDRMLIGTGSGIKARVNMGAPTTSLVVDSAFGASLGSDVLGEAWLQFLEGESIVFSVAADGDPLRNAGTSQSAKIEDIDPATYTLELDALPAGVADNDYIFEGDASGTSSQTATGDDREIMGLLGMVDDGTLLAEFQELARQDYRQWNAISIDGADATRDYDGTLSEDVLMYADDQTAVLGGGKPDLIVTSRSGVRSYWKALRQDRSINDPRSYMGGKGPVSVLLGDRELPLKAVRKLPHQLCFGLQRNTFRRWELEGYQWDDKTGAIWNRVVDSVGRKDAFFAVGNWYMQTGCIAPRKNFRIYNLAAA